MSYTIAFPRRGIQEPGSKEHVVTQFTIYGGKGMTACGKSVSTSWNWRISSAPPHPTRLCGGCEQVSERWLSKSPPGKPR